jgi:hypothetical protein
MSPEDCCVIRDSENTRSARGVKPGWIGAQRAGRSIFETRDKRTPELEFLPISDLLILLYALCQALGQTVSGPLGRIPGAANEAKLSPSFIHSSLPTNHTFSAPNWMTMKCFPCCSSGKYFSQRSQRPERLDRACSGTAGMDCSNYRSPPTIHLISSVPPRHESRRARTNHNRWCLSAMTHIDSPSPARSAELSIHAVSVQLQARNYQR